MTLCYHKKSKSHRKILFWQRYGCSLWQTVSTPILFVVWLVHAICILAFQIPSYMPNGDKRSATKIFNIKGDIAISCCSSPPTVSRYFPKWQVQRVLFPFLETCHRILKCTLHYQFPFLEIWPWKSISKYLNEISTKHCQTTKFRKPLTKATQLIDPEIM